MEKNKKSKVFSEVFAFINLLGDEYKSKIPPKFMSFLKENMDLNYKPNVSKNIPIKNQNLHRTTIAMIAKINLQYWASSEEKEKLLEIYKSNDEKRSNFITGE